MTSLTDWDLTVATLHARGTVGNALCPSARRRVWAQGNGYGQRSIAQLEADGLMEDWSHIRDSDDVALQSVATAIRTELLAMDREEQARGLGSVFPDGTCEETLAKAVKRLGTLEAL